MALVQGDIVQDINRGTVAITILRGAIQADVVLRMNREDFLKGKSPIECLNLEDRYLFALLEGTSQSIQHGLGYEPANFINPADIQML
jgi:hypothetical protein